MVDKTINDVPLKNLTFQTGQKKMGQREYYKNVVQNKL